MRASVRTRDVSIEIRGVIPTALLEVLRLEYQHRLLIAAEGIAQMVDVLHAPMYDPEPRPMGPGDYLRFYRAMGHLTQKELALKLGDIPRQNISAMERGRRSIGKRMARRLAAFFGVPASRFLHAGRTPPPITGQWRPSRLPRSSRSPPG